MTIREAIREKVAAVPRGAGELTKAYFSGLVDGVTRATEDDFDLSQFTAEAKEVLESLRKEDGV